MDDSYDLFSVVVGESALIVKSPIMYPVGYHSILSSLPLILSCHDVVPDIDVLRPLVVGRFPILSHKNCTSIILDCYVLFDSRSLFYPEVYTPT